MLWLIIPAAGAGVVLGLTLFRALAVFATSVALSVTAVVSMMLGHWPLLEIIVYTFMLLAALQCSYLIGVIFSIRWKGNTVSECSGVHRLG